MSMPEAELPTVSKKRRIDEVDAPSVTQSPKFWFEDGTVILQAEAHQFRVHRGVLSENSSFFADLFKLPQPENDPLIDGRPLVHVRETAQEWEDMLTMLYNPLSTQKSIEFLPFTFLHTLLRLGTKYQFDLIRDYALDRFKSIVPSQNQNSGSCPQLKDIKHVIDSLNLAVDLGIETVLPVLYYACCIQLKMEEILDGRSREDGTHSCLSSRAQRTLILGRDRLQYSLIADVWGWLIKADGSPCHSCTAPKNCREMFDILRGFPCWTIETLYVINVRLRANDLPFCPSCQTEVCQKAEVGHKVFWDTLPARFGLPKWRDLSDLVLE